MILDRFSFQLQWLFKVFDLINFKIIRQYSNGTLIVGQVFILRSRVKFVLHCEYFGSCIFEYWENGYTHSYCNS